MRCARSRSDPAYLSMASSMLRCGSLPQHGTEDVLVRYELTPEDLKGLIRREDSTDYAEMAQMKRLSYTSPIESPFGKVPMFIPIC